MGFAYRTTMRLRTIERLFFEDYEEDVDPSTMLDLIRIHDLDQFAEDGPLGAKFWLESGKYPCVSTTLAPLSDFYYDLTQNAFYTLGTRKFDFNDLGAHLMKYMSWGTYPCTNRGA